MLAKDAFDKMRTLLAGDIAKDAYKALAGDPVPMPPSAATQSQIMATRAAMETYAGPGVVSQSMQAQAENPDLVEAMRKTERRQAMLKQMESSTQQAEKQVAAVTINLLRLIKGYSPTALAQALAQDKDARDVVNLAVALTPAFINEEPTP
jgi:hypothetical protein